MNKIFTSRHLGILANMHVEGKTGNQVFRVIKLLSVDQAYRSLYITMHNADAK